jgi:hypothetical protein
MNNGIRHRPRLAKQAIRFDRRIMENETSYSAHGNGTSF